LIQSQIPGKPHLNLLCTSEELNMIEHHVNPNRSQLVNFTKLGTDDSPTSVDGILCLLPEVSFAHFTCHRSQNFSKPLESGLHLSDGELKIAQIMQHPLPLVSLAFLSACETAKGTEDDPDEALHIAATMLYTGFHGIVGTMWYCIHRSNHEC
jgi:CHAT domain-containing protein